MRIRLSIAPIFIKMHHGLTFFRRVTTVGQALPPMTAKERPPINVVGDVGGRIAIMVDDMIDDVQAFIDAALVLKDRYYSSNKAYLRRRH